FSGREAEIETTSSKATNASSPPPTGVIAWVRPTLDGETIHYVVKISVRVRQNPEDAERTIVQELTHSGDARLDQPVFVDIGKTDRGHRYVARLLFRRGTNASTPPTNEAWSH